MILVNADTVNLTFNPYGPTHHVPGRQSSADTWRSVPAYLSWKPRGSMDPKQHKPGNATVSRDSEKTHSRESMQSEDTMQPFSIGGRAPVALPDRKIMRINISAGFFCLGVLLAHPVFADAEDQHAAITRLGELNGVALQCRYFEQMQRIKQTLVVNLPKKRELGLLFEDATNRSFLAFMQQDETCPGSADFVSQIDSAVSDLEAAFAK